MLSDAIFILYKLFYKTCTSCCVYQIHMEKKVRNSSWMVLFLLAFDLN